MREDRGPGRSGPLRWSDVPILVGDATKIHHALGWTPKIPFVQTLQDVLNYWQTRWVRSDA